MPTIAPFFIEAWKRFQPSARTYYFERHCDAIRLRAWEEMAGAFDIRPQSQQLTALGYSDRELAEIRATLDIFDYGNPKYLVLATAIKESLCKGRRLGGREGTQRAGQNASFTNLPDRAHSGHGRGTPCPERAAGGL
ncbi:MAG: halocarboxylic acid dehydrogenase DehI family protein [Marinobacter sp.]|nr:halocarboxylic acid dehydrogenase DehI family protein [Marinobacter sp.]